MNRKINLTEELSRIKTLMTIKNDEVILEESKISVADLVTRFSNATLSGTVYGNDKVFEIINLMDRVTFLNFVVELNKKTGKSFNAHINRKFNDSDGADVLKLQQLLKSKFNIDSNTSLTGNENMNARTRVFKKAFRITSFNQTIPQQPVADTNTDLGKERVVKTGPNPTDFVVVKPGEQAPPEWKPEQAKKETTTQSSQTYNDILSGKGVLKTGVTSPAVGELQQKLINLGYTSIAKPTNYFGTQTFNAVKDFQEKNSLTDDGKVGKDTSKKIDEILANKNKTTDNTSKSAEPTTATSSSNLRGATSAAQQYVPKGVSADFK